MYNINELNLGESIHAGHEVYLYARYSSAQKPNSLGFKQSPKHIIFKRNKFNNLQFSRLEVAFTQLARLFLSRGLTAPQQLVIDNTGDIVGLAADHMDYVIAEKEGLERSFYTLNLNENEDVFIPKKVITAEDIPIYFLDKIPQGFFSQLLKAEKAGVLRINYQSLASLFASSYTLEEDDLHKGNFGFYLIEKEGQPEAVFFKIDHDLMLADTVMSFYQMRPQQLFYDEHAFDITAEDLVDFPDLHHSANNYWPTKKTIFPFWSKKGYKNKEENEAFADLNKVASFKRAKWLSFYKHILIPTELTECVLERCLDKNNPVDRAQIALMGQAISARQARLRAMLFSLAEFRHFVNQLSESEKNSLIEETLHLCPARHKERVSIQVHHSLSSFERLCDEDHFEEGDTPLHVAIKLGDFRYEETMSMFGHLVNEKNKSGKTPLDSALERVSQAEIHQNDIRHDLRLTMNYLLKHGAVASDAFNRFNSKESVETYQFKTSYLNKAQKVRSYPEFKEILRDIGEDHSFCLKFKKKLAVACVQHFIANNKNNLELLDSLKLLKKEMSEEVPELKYIRQLRSRLWIIRQLRGLYGWTTTQGEINTLINGLITEDKDSYYSPLIYS
jgi:hypothetical protein